MSLNPVAYKDGRPVSLEEARRHDVGLTCPTCDGKLVVKDGRGQFVVGESPRNRRKGKHFSHTASNGCHGEGPVHYRVKMALCKAINAALKMPKQERKSHGIMFYRCPDVEYGPKDSSKSAPGAGGPHREFEQMQHGYHHYDLIHCSKRTTWTAPILHHAESEIRLDGGRTRADIAGFDAGGNVLWVIEIQHSGLSDAAINHATEKGVPLFVVDLSHLPQPSADDPMAGTNCIDYYILGDNLARGFYPCANKSFNTQCERKATGMGPDDHNWLRWIIYVHKGPVDCGSVGCPECEEVVLHECGELDCPDNTYMFEKDIDPVTMYTDPSHRANSHTLQLQGVAH